MSRQISLYKDTKHLEAVCNLSLWIEYFLLIFFLLFYAFISFMMIEYPEDDLSPGEMRYFIIGTIILAALWWRIFKYYAFDLIIKLEIQGDMIYLHSMYQTYCFEMNCEKAIKEGLNKENMILTFKLKTGKSKRKYFRRYVVNGQNRIENLDLDLLKDIFEIEG